jgi:steroid delta-isomerase-like uncharacterized protein
MDVWASRDFEMIDNIFTADGVYEDAADQSKYEGIQEIKDFMRECVTWAPDTKVEPLSVFVSGNKGAVEWIWSGTQTGDIPDLMKATGKSFRICGVTILEFEHGKIKKNVDYYNAARFLHQLGVGFDFPAMKEVVIEHLNATRASLKQAMLEGDIETLRRIYSDDYGLVTRRGILLTRAERIEMLESGRLKYLDVGVETAVTVRVYGNTAVVRGVVDAAVTEFDGERRESHARRFTEMGVNESGDWREVSRQTTVIEIQAA